MTSWRFLLGVWHKQERDCAKKERESVEEAAAGSRSLNIDSRKI